jgi:hypothetical protein
LIFPLNWGLSFVYFRASPGFSSPLLGQLFGDLVFGVMYACIASFVVSFACFSFVARVALCFARSFVLRFAFLSCVSYLTIWCILHRVLPSSLSIHFQLTWHFVPFSRFVRSDALSVLLSFSWFGGIQGGIISIFRCVPFTLHALKFY